MSTERIYIIGAGLAGLVAALELEKAGLKPIILEASDDIGGRVRTDKHDGFLLDRGFQVLLTAYPEAQRYLDFEGLKLKEFEPGAYVFSDDHPFLISDPLRQPLKMFSMAISPVGSILDKIKMFSLTLELKKKSIENIFDAPSISTIEYLREYGFSEKIIENFFSPFFRGIFLEKELLTSSRMFEFVFKMFSSGNAAIPEKGMGEIPAMLRRKLKNTEIHLNSSVDKVMKTQIIMSDGEVIQADRIIIATQPDRIMDQLKGQFPKPKMAATLYFSLEKSFMVRPMLGLVPGNQHLINNLVFMSDVSASYSSNGRALLSVSIHDSKLTENQLIEGVKGELQKISGINAEYFKFVKSYFIPHAIPTVDDMKSTISFTETKIADHVFLAGDYLLNGSVNAAMGSGRLAAEAVLLSLTRTH
jgi:protoporphyrinogen oxidase